MKQMSETYSHLDGKSKKYIYDKISASVCL